MPVKPFRPCSKTGCKGLTRNKYCDAHANQSHADKAESDKHYNQYKRDKTSQGFYKSHEWKVLSQTFYIKHQGLCQHCLTLNKMVHGTTDKNGRFRRNIVDHIIPITADWNKRMDENNLQILCIPCHNRKTNEDKRKFKV